MPLNEAHKFFLKLRRARREAVILESAAPGGWTFVGEVDPRIKVPLGEEGLKFIRQFVRKNHRPKKRGEPPFTGGFAGFVSYDLGERWVFGPKSTRARRSEFRCPEAFFVYVNKVEALRNKEGSRNVFSQKAKHAASVISSSISRKIYLEKIRRIKEYLAAGETYQVNLSQKFEASMPAGQSAFSLYQKLTRLNPSPFQFFMETPGFAVISNSPERLMKITSGLRVIDTRPIKGTMPRGHSTAEEKAGIARLLASAKDRAELAMIVDLERNDLGKICIPGTVRVTEHRTIEKYSHVIHTAANVRGVLAEQCDWYDALRALFPGGSITGCPKKRTMEIIRELEDEPRGVYCGSAGYIDLSGNCDFNIMIRTLWLDKKRLVWRSGGGIVADSVAQKEYEETLHKAEVIFNAIA